jgi:hypothetical protein
LAYPLIASGWQAQAREQSVKNSDKLTRATPAQVLAILAALDYEDEQAARGVQADSEQAETVQRSALYYPEKDKMCSHDDVPPLPETDGLARAFTAIVEAHLRRQREKADKGREVHGDDVASDSGSPPRHTTPRNESSLTSSSGDYRQNCE